MPEVAASFIVVAPRSSDPGVVGGPAHAPPPDLHDRQRCPKNQHAVQTMSVRNRRLLSERHPRARPERLDELRAIVADPVRAKAHPMDTSTINSVRQAAAIH